MNTCAHRDCAAETDSLICEQHTLALRLIGHGVDPDLAHRLATLTFTGFTLHTHELIEDSDGNPAGVIVTQTHN